MLHTPPSTLPPSPPQPDARPRGTFVLVLLPQGLTPGWVPDPHHRRKEVLLPDGRREEALPHQVLFQWKDTPPSPTDPFGSRVPAGQPWQPLPPVPMETLHGRLPPGVAVPFAQAAELAEVGGEPRGERGWTQAALFAAMTQSDDLFRRARGGFVARTQVERQQREERARQEHRQAHEKNQAARWATRLRENAWPPAEGTPDDHRAFLERLHLLALRGKSSPHWKELSHLLDLHPHQPEENGAKVKALLSAAGAWPGWEALWLEWGEASADFPPHLLAEAEKLAAQPLATAGRVDYRGNPTFTVDSPNTKDFDDAFSLLGQSGEEVEVAVHIAHPAPELPLEHPLMQEAARRMSSVYTPGKVCPMFPEALSNGRFSLRAGEDREALTFRFWLGPAGARLARIEESIIRVQDNLDYDQAETLMARDPNGWGRVAECCQGLALARQAQGALLANRPEVMIELTAEEQVILSPVHREGPGHRMVEELAILTNQATGRACASGHLPAIYRVQPRGRGPNPAKYPLPAARFSTEPGPHAGLACDYYIQATSPIRRFPDLVMQRQLAASLRGETPPFPGLDMLEAWARQAEVRFAVYGDVEKRVDDHWKREFLRQYPALPLTGEVRKVLAPRKLDRVMLDGLWLSADALLPAGSRPGQRFRFRLEDVDPDRRKVVVTGTTALDENTPSFSLPWTPPSPEAP
ncbi:MAG: ribonuclease catalytic domain-containing protein [Deltaproteobacteria bacterium]|nr:ribonuclease catalytic domain-containing protein [Deltaproteobacteria bacterium]